MFYCKISERRTGKTTKLVSDLLLLREWNKIYKKYNKFVVVTMNKFVSRQIFDAMCFLNCKYDDFSDIEFLS